METTDMDEEAKITGAKQQRKRGSKPESNWAESETSAKPWSPEGDDFQRLQTLDCKELVLVAENETLPSNERCYAVNRLGRDFWDQRASFAPHLHRLLQLARENEVRWEIVKVFGKSSEISISDVAAIQAASQGDRSVVIRGAANRIIDRWAKLLATRPADIKPNETIDLREAIGHTPPATREVEDKDVTLADRPVQPLKALDALVGSLAADEKSHRETQAARIKAFLDTYFRNTIAPDFVEKVRIADSISDCLARFELTLTCKEKPCRLKAERKDENDVVGFWVIEPKGAKSKLIAKEAEASKLPLLDVVPAPVLGPWQAKEQARRQEVSQPNSPTSGAITSDVFGKLLAESKSSREEFAHHLLEPLKERLRGMPHETIGERKKIARWLNNELREAHLRLQCPTTKQPAILIVALTNAGGPRFVFFHRDERGKPCRSFSTIEFEEFLKHIALVPAPPRKNSHRG
jgi:hypothetical protein